MEEKQEEMESKGAGKGAGRRSTPKYKSPQDALEGYTKKHDLSDRSYQ